MVRSIYVQPMAAIDSRHSNTMEQPSNLLPIAIACVLLFTTSMVTLVDAVDPAASCVSSNCLEYSRYFYDVYDEYKQTEYGYYYPPAWFHFFIALCVIIYAVWLAFFVLNARSVWSLAEALHRERVIRVPAVWASARHSITRDVLALWLAPHEAPILPVSVNKLPIRAHFPMANAKLSVNPASIGGGASSPLSPSGVVSPTSNPNAEYTLKLNLSTSENYSCLVEVWFGVPLKTVSLFLSDYSKFKLRHSKSDLKSPPAPMRKPSPNAVGDKAASPLMRGKDGPLVMQVSPATGTSNEAFTRSDKNRFRVPENTDESPPHTPNRGGRSSRVSPGLVINTSSPLPGTAPSPHNSPSHVTKESESKHLSHLSLREKERGSLSQIGSTGKGGGILGLRPSSPPTSLSPPSAPVGSTTTAAAAGGSIGSPSPSPTGVVVPLATLKPQDGTGLFRPSEALFTLPPTIYGPGLKQLVQVNFPQKWLQDTLQDSSKCPILILVSPIDDSNSAYGLNGGFTGGYIGGELTIVQFAPAPSGSPGTKDPANGAGGWAKQSPPPAALPAPAIQSQVPEPDDVTVQDGEAKEAETEEKEPLSPSVQSPTGMQDAVTLRVRFDRQLMVMEDDTFEMEELYGMDESDAECIICLTDIRDVILLPCRHVCVCQGCFKSISKCPICRARIHSHMTFTAPKAPISLVPKEAAEAPEKKEKKKKKKKKERESADINSTEEPAGDAVRPSSN